MRWCSKENLPVLKKIIDSCFYLHWLLDFMFLISIMNEFWNILNLAFFFLISPIFCTIDGCTLWPWPAKADCTECHTLVFSTTLLGFDNLDVSRLIVSQGVSRIGFSNSYFTGPSIFPRENGLPNRVLAWNDVDFIFLLRERTWLQNPMKLYEPSSREVMYEHNKQLGTDEQTRFQQKQ